MNVVYSCSTDPSGYSSAARADIAALFVSGVNVSVNAVKQMSEDSDYGLLGDITKRLQNRKITPKVHIFHLTPDLLPKYKQNCYTISRLAWETDTLPKEWIVPLNDIDEIWTMSEQMKHMIEKNGVTTKVTVMPQPIDTSVAEEVIEPFLLPLPTSFIFYTIAQWIDRKNFKTLITSYWKAFSGNNEVSLLIKTYRNDYTDAQRQLIKAEIELLRKSVPLAHYPKILLTKNLLTEEHIKKLHALGTCYVNPSSGEGWCRPMAEAMLAGNLVVSGSNGGLTDYLSEKEYVMVDSLKTKATQQSHIPWYTSSMQWQEVSEVSLVKVLKDVYSNYSDYDLVAKNGKEFVLKNFSLQVVGEQMKKRLEEITL